MFVAIAGRLCYTDKNKTEKGQNTMLRRLRETEFDRYAEFAYQVALDPAHASYPAYFDGIKTRENFFASAREAMQSLTAEVLLYERDGRVLGWLQYFWIPDERYLQLTACCVAEDIAGALTAFVRRVQARFAGFTCVCGFPAENTQALAALQEAGFSCAERTYNCVCFLDAFAASAPDAALVRVTETEFDRFRRLHAPVESGMYWTSERLLHALDQWQIFLLESGGEDLGAVYLTGDTDMTEVFGVDLAPGAGAGALRALLSGALAGEKRRGARRVIYFCEPERAVDAFAVGFTLVGEYVCMERTL